MNECSCESRGWCPVLGIHTTEQLRKICQKNHDQAKRIASAMVAGNAKPKVNEPSESRRERIAQAVAAKQKLISWLRLLKSESDCGIGDTANRLRLQRTKSKTGVTADAKDAIARLLSQRSCSKLDAISCLNRDYPY